MLKRFVSDFKIHVVTEDPYRIRLRQNYRRLLMKCSPYSEFLPVVYPRTEKAHHKQVDAALNNNFSLVVKITHPYFFWI